MRLNYLAAASAAALAFAATPATATILVQGDEGVPFTAFAGPLGTFLDGFTATTTTATFTGEVRTAVYRNEFGRLDFLFQFANTANGTSGATSAVRRLTGFDFGNYIIDALFSSADLDGAGFFTAENNPGAPATADRLDGVVGVDFAASNRVAKGQTSATYIFRTNALDYNRNGTVSVIDGSTWTADGFQPTGAVPEPATWGLMVLGFGALGAAMRRRPAQVAF